MTENLPALPEFSWPSTETNQFDVKIAQIQSDTYRYFVSKYVDAIRIQSNAAIWSEQIRQHEETMRGLVRNTRDIMIRTIDAHCGNGPIRYIDSEVKFKERGLFGRGCKVTVRSMAIPALPAFQLRGPAR